MTHRANPNDVKFRIEVKTWYALSRDRMTARFKTHESYLLEDDMLLVGAWILDGVVNGSPKLIRLYIDRALPIAVNRDKRWAEAENRKVEAPNNPLGTMPNLVQTASIPYTKRGGVWVAEAKNFGKLHRLGWEGLLTFSTSVLGLEIAGRSLDAWRRFITTTPGGAEEEDDEAEE